MFSRLLATLRVRPASLTAPPPVIAPLVVEPAGEVTNTDAIAIRQLVDEAARIVAAQDERPAA